MARVLAIDGQIETALTVWRLAVTPAGTCEGPVEAARLREWVDAQAPGTAAGALHRAGQFDPATPEPLHDKDIWWRCALPQAGPHILRFEGIAILAEAWLDERPILSSRSMYATHQLDVDLCGGETLWLCCRALGPLLERKLPRARWRTRLIPKQAWRGVRATLLGQMPGWTPPIDAVGPWRPVTLSEAHPLRLEADVRASFDGRTGRLHARVRAPVGEAAVRLHCDGRTVDLAPTGEGAVGGVLDLPGIEPWWPHTHGDPTLHAVHLTIGETSVDLGRTGFRSLTLNREPNGQGFGLEVNGTAVFCRGANWTSPGILDLPCSRQAYEPWLRLVHEAGMNMLRMSGTGAYEGPAFYDLCDELGILVWQDFMFANFDYPLADDGFADEAAREARTMLDRVQLSPCLAVACGGSEVMQQAAMFGLEAHETGSELYASILPDVVAALRPDLVWVENSPHGGPVPFAPNVGVAHYYGVGAYLRPLEDARRAEVRFASECLAFANLPEAGGAETSFGQALPAKAGVPRDLGADWDFEDVRDHYLARLHRVDPARLKSENPDLYLDLSRAVSGEVMEAVFTEWRRVRSTCRGGLVWTLQDLAPGAGWGVIDSSGRPKAAWYALKRAFRPLHLGMTDEGVAGLAVHMVNEGPRDLDLELELSGFRPDGRLAFSRRRPIRLAGRSAEELSAWTVIGAFHDVNYAYRFGPPSHEGVIARLRQPGDETVLAEAFHFVQHVGFDAGPCPLSARLEAPAGGWTLVLTAHRLARLVRIHAQGFRPSDNWLHLAPGAQKTVCLQAESGVSGRPAGRIDSPVGGWSVSFS